MSSDRQLSFQDFVEDANEWVIQESNKRVADAARGLAMRIAQREETLLLHTLTTDQLKILVCAIHRELEKRGVV